MKFFAACLFVFSLGLGIQNCSLADEYSANPDEFLSHLVTQDETWVHHFEPETKRQSLQWRHVTSPPPKKFKVGPSAKKVMASVFWDKNGIIMVEYLPKGSTVTGAYFADQLRRLRECMKKTRRGLLRKDVWPLQDNAPPHTSQIAIAAADQCGYRLLPHPPYSPDLAPSDYYLFANLKLHVKGRRVGWVWKQPIATLISCSDGNLRRMRRRVVLQ